MDKYLEMIRNFEAIQKETIAKRTKLEFEMANLDTNSISENIEETTRRIAELENQKEIIEKPTQRLKEYKEMALEETTRRYSSLIFWEMVLFIASFGACILSTFIPILFSIMGPVILVLLGMFGISISAFIYDYKRIYKDFSKDYRQMLEELNIESIEKEINELREKLVQLEAQKTETIERQNELEEKIKSIKGMLIRISYYIEKLTEERSKRVDEFNKRHLFDETLNMHYASSANSSKVEAVLSRMKKEIKPETDNQ